MTDEMYTIAEPTIDAGLASGFDRSSGRARLVVYIEGDPGQPSARRPDGSIGTRTRMIELPEDVPVTFGRSRACTVHTDSDRVSRNHAQVIRQGGDIVVEDLGSRNGTRVNGAKITEATRLSSSDEVTIGPITVLVSAPTRAARHTRIGATWYLDERLAAEVDRGQRYRRPCSLVMLRIEGQADAADAALARLVAKLRPMDTIAEYGPDELAILLPERDLAAGMDTAGELLAAARGEAPGRGGAVVIRAGIAALPQHGSRAGALLTQARNALRRARSDGADQPVAPPTADPGKRATIVADPRMKQLYAMVRKVAGTPMTVLIGGETGAGKEIIAEAIHREGTRKDGPFMRLNCACIADTLLESELFGHERGAFTGADRRKQGYFEAAAGGTLFLDEIGEISPSVQAKLLRVLEQRTIVRLGGTKEIAVDTRVVCATNRDLQVEVERGGFRQDLYFRISAFVLMVPPLRDRAAEIPLLAEYFVAQSAGDLGAAAPVISAAASACLAAYDWPGNVRELRNAMERALVLQTDGTIALEHLPERVRLGGGAASLAGANGNGDHRPGPASVQPSDRPLGSGAGPRARLPSVSDVREHVADVERQQVIAALEACGGNQTKAARKLGLSRRALIYRMEKYGLKPPPASRQ